MEAGKLRHRVAIEERAPESQDAAGQLIPSWTAVATDVPAAVESINAREFMAQQGLASQITAKIRMRWRDGVDATMRVKHEVYGTNGILLRVDLYNIAGVLPDSESGRVDMVLLCTRGTNDG